VDLFCPFLDISNALGSPASGAYKVKALAISNGISRIYFCKPSPAGYILGRCCTFLGLLERFIEGDEVAAIALGF
jgi:hypothetical protein